jgi:carotenoid cleavage dioxygenase
MSTENRAPVSTESSFHALPVEGALPDGLNGTLYRNGPNPIEQDQARHWFHGHGMVHAFAIGNGKIAYRNRWVRTQLWAKDTGADWAGLPGGVANTNIVANAGALLALEELHMPVMLDRASLETLGTWNFHGELAEGPFTAHPKTCSVTGNLVFFGYGTDGYFGDTIRLGEITRQGKLLGLDTIHAPYGGAMIHDFAVTEHFLAIPLFPLLLDEDAGGYVWKPERGAFLGIIDRAQGPDSLRWHPVNGGFAFHVANAWDEAGRLTIDLMLSEAPSMFPSTAEHAPASDASFLTRWELEPGTSSPVITQRQLSLIDGEFPRLDERWAGRRNAHLFWTAGEALCARNDLTGEEALYRLEPGDTASEPVFVPRGTGEGDGWLLSILYRHATRSSDLAILDAQLLADGPVALAKLPVRVPDGFHGAWLGDVP